MKKARKAPRARAAKRAKPKHAGRAKIRHSRASHKGKAKTRPKASIRMPEKSMPLQKAADEVPTLEQVTITCANCGRPFKMFKLKGLNMEGTICQRCSLGEMELPESFG